MAAHAGDGKTFSAMAAAYFAGRDAATMARELGIARETAAEQVEALESVLILAAHELPESLLPRGARLSTEVATALLGEIRSRLGSPEAMRAFIACRPSVIAPRPVAAAAGEPQQEDAAPGEDAEQALAVLEFWASKWL